MSGGVWSWLFRVGVGVSAVYLAAQVWPTNPAASLWMLLAAANLIITDLAYTLLRNTMQRRGIVLGGGR